MESIALPSYAKINLGLLLLDKREDGYHDIATVFQQIDLHDEIVFRKTVSGVRIVSSDATLPTDEGNLLHRAFRAFQDRLDVAGGLGVRIQKHIPVGAGLGGGSSNAAVTLLAADRLWNTKLSTEKLEALASEIGSDVPFFLRGGTAFGQGRGEGVTPLRWATDYWIVLVCPDIRVSTAWAYSRARIALTKEEKITKFRSIFENFTPHTLKETLFNELEGVVLQRHPVLRKLKEQMYRRDAFYASMSGSGSSVYGLFLDRGQAEAAKVFFAEEQGMRVFLCRPVSSHPLQSVS